MSLATQIKSLQETRVQDLRRQAAAFAAVFGQPGKRSSDQRIVIGALAQLCGQEQTRGILDKDGRIDPLSAVFNEATRSVYLFIDSQLALAASDRPQELAKPKR